MPERSEGTTKGLRVIVLYTLQLLVTIHYENVAVISGRV